MSAASSVTLRWPAAGDDGLVDRVHRIVGPVVELGGAVGWLTPPTRAEVAAWLGPVLDAVGAGDAALCLAEVHGTALAMGYWERASGAVFAHRAALRKIMAHPDGRGLGLGRRVTAALVDHAGRAGIETLTLGVRGNNHLAIAIYRAAGFEEWGRIPDSIAVGDERFDDVVMGQRLARPAHLRLRGSEPVGPGSSPGPAGRADRPAPAVVPEVRAARAVDGEEVRAAPAAVPEVRAARAADGEEVVRLAGIMYGAMGHDISGEAWREAARAALGSRLGADAAVFVAEDPTRPGRLVALGGGSIGVRLPGPTAPDNRVGYVQWMSTDPAWRGRGLARAILAALLDWFSALGVATVELHATADGEAIYRATGFDEGPYPALRRRLPLRSD